MTFDLLSAQVGLFRSDVQYKLILFYPSEVNLWSTSISEWPWPLTYLFLRRQYFIKMSDVSESYSILIPVLNILNKFLDTDLNTAEKQVQR